MSPSGSRGRGAYYKAKYGGSRVGGRQTPQNDADFSSRHGRGRDDAYALAKSRMSFVDTRSWQELTEVLLRIDNKPYGAYHDIEGSFLHYHPDFTLRIDHIQGDPFAPPSRIALIISKQEAGFNEHNFATDTSCIALADFVTRATAEMLREKALDQNVRAAGWAGPKGGAFNINAPGQEVLQRNSCIIRPDRDFLELRLTASLPARGRSILGQQAREMLCNLVPSIVRQTLILNSHDETALNAHIACIEQQERLRGQLAERGLVSFIANGSVLPRASGSASLPMASANVKKFQSPSAYEVTLQGFNRANVTGMGISKGVTVLTGGGFHGKSTLLEAIQMGVYNQIPGDGREAVVTDATAMKIRAEDGRRISGVNISPFISNLPGKQDIERFATEDASGSTSMAANIQEALEMGSKTLIIDEDSSATNLLVRDIRMQNLIKAEPITPLVCKARALYNQHGVSTVIVIGGCGDYLSIADCVIGMDSYLPYDLTPQAREIVSRYPASVEQHAAYGSIPRRQVSLGGAALGQKPLQARGVNFLATRTSESANPVRNPSEGEDGIELSGVEQLVEPGQLRLIGECLRRISLQSSNGAVNLKDTIESIQAESTVGGLDSVHSQGHLVGDLVQVRGLELAAALNRTKGLRVQGA